MEESEIEVEKNEQIEEEKEEEKVEKEEEQVKKEEEEEIEVEKKIEEDREINIIKNNNNNNNNGEEKPIVVVTGANGFIAAHIIVQLLDKGYRVRGTVRNLEDKKSYDFLNKEEYADRLSFFAANLIDEGSFDEAISGADYVMHTASPYALIVNDSQKDLVDPAVRGTLTVLESCKKFPSIKKVILTSSVAAITDSPISGKKYTENDWNLGKKESSLERNPYYYSKRLAEEAAWDFMKKENEKNPLHFNLIVINPFVVVGPSLNKKLNPSNVSVRDTLIGKMPIIALAWGFVDVRDVARSHIAAMENENANGRYICCNCTWTMAQLANFLRPKYPNYPIATSDLSGSVGSFFIKIASYFQPKQLGVYVRTNLGCVPDIDNSKIKNELNFEFTPIEQTIEDTVNYLIAAGFDKVGPNEKH